jgi:hypothetical protein
MTGNSKCCGFAPFEAGVADAQGMIDGNRSIETGQKAFWPQA